MERSHGFAILLDVANFVVGTLLIFFAFLAYVAQRDFHECSTFQSPICMAATCPNDAKTHPCFGYAQRKDDKGNTYCSFNPNIPVGKTRSSGLTRIIVLVGAILAEAAISAGLYFLFRDQANPILMYVLLFVEIILVLVFLLLTIHYYHMNTQCFVEQSFWCYNDWTCGDQTNVLKTAYDIANACLPTKDGVVDPTVCVCAWESEGSCQSCMNRACQNILGTTCSTDPNQNPTWDENSIADTCKQGR